jgi:hypothetical protein
MAGTDPLWCLAVEVIELDGWLFSAKGLAIGDDVLQFFYVPFQSDVTSMMK